MALRLERTDERLTRRINTVRSDSAGYNRTGCRISLAQGNGLSVTVRNRDGQYFARGPGRK